MSREIDDTPTTGSPMSKIGEIGHRHVDDGRRPCACGAFRVARHGRPFADMGAGPPRSPCFRSGGTQKLSVPPDCLFGGVAERRVGAVVPARDHAVERLADDRVVGRLDDRRQLRQPGARLVERRDVGRASARRRRASVVRSLGSADASGARPARAVARDTAGCAGSSSVLACPTSALRWSRRPAARARCRRMSSGCAMS